MLLHLSFPLVEMCFLELCCSCALSVLFLCSFCALSVLFLCSFVAGGGPRPGTGRGLVRGSRRQSFIRKHSVFVWEMTAAWDRSGAGQRLQTAVISCENTVLLYGSETNFWGGSKFLVEMLYFSEVRFFHAYITKNGNSTCCALR